MNIQRGALLRGVLAISALPSPAVAAQLARIHGKVVSIDYKRRTFLIHHDPFPAMPMAMTMEVRPKSGGDLAKLHVGEVVNATIDMSVSPWSAWNIRPAVSSTNRR